MRAVGLGDLEKNLGKYVRLAEGGETVLITKGDRVVAEISPPRESRAQSMADAHLAALVREGLLTPARRPPGPPPEVLRTLPLAEVLADLARDRSER